MAPGLEAIPDKNSHTQHNTTEEDKSAPNPSHAGYLGENEVSTQPFLTIHTYTCGSHR